MRRIAGTSWVSSVPDRSATCTLDDVTPPICRAAVWLRSASLRTSVATTAKPLPCSPARAASMAALSASRFVWYAISSTIEICSAITRMASTVSRTAVALPSASRAPRTAVCSVSRLLAALRVIDALICSRLDVVSSTAAACSLVPCDSACDVAEICTDAAVNAPAPALTSPITCDNRSSICARALPSVSREERGCTATVRSPAATRAAAFAIASVERTTLPSELSSWPTSSCEVAMTASDVSPCARRSATATARAKGRTSPRAISTEKIASRANANTVTTAVQRTACAERSRAPANAAAAFA